MRLTLQRSSQQRIALVFSIVALLAVIAMNYDMIKARITGMALYSNVGVAVEPVTKGIITKVILGSTLLELGERQSVFVEFLNYGSTTLDMKIEHHYYVYNEGKLDLVASYYDSQYLLPPGSKRRYNSTFLAPETGLYYVRIRIPYNNKVAQTWESFYVYSQAIVVVVGGPAIGPPAPPAAGPASTSLEAPDEVRIVQGDYGMFQIRIKNTGESVLNNLRFFISNPDDLNISVVPKTISGLGLNSSTTFLITVGVPSETPIGTYPIEIEFTTDELKKSKIIDIIALGSSASLMEYLQNLILNYEYLISVVESDIYSATLDGYDVSLANESLNHAKLHMQAAKSNFSVMEFDDTKRELNNVIRYLEDAVFQLASATLFEYRPPAHFPLLLVLLEAFLALLVFILFFLYRRRKEKPKALRKGTET
jgi:hypothetical protein